MRERPSVLSLTVSMQAKGLWGCGQLPSPALSVNSFERVDGKGDFFGFLVRA